MAETDSLAVKRLSDAATIPYRATDGSAGFDLCASEPTTIESGRRKVVKTDLVLGIPAGHYGRIAPRSGLAFKYGIDVCAGVIDSDYRGPVGCVLSNAGTESFAIRAGDRIAQLIIEKISLPNVMEVSSLDATTRGSGGFGSTGTTVEAHAASAAPGAANDDCTSSSAPSRR